MDCPKGMNGAESIVRALINHGIDTYPSNLGTSEIHFVRALENIDETRVPVLGLFDGVVTGATDGSVRAADRPPATLLHLGTRSEQPLSSQTARGGWPPCPASQHHWWWKAA
jgi:acetolactate synthase I/II/III large subunit